MKIAIVFDDLIQNGGAEKLLIVAHEIWPNAPLYTCLSSREWVRYCQTNNIKLITSFMQKIPFAVKLNKVLAVFGFHILAYESFNFDKFDIVLSISARFAHGVITKPTTKHICYMNSPGRMFWEPNLYFINRFLQIILAPFLSWLRIWDYSAAQRVDRFIANSKTPQNRIKKYYKRDSDIVYPFAEDVTQLQNTNAGEKYFLIISRLISWKKIEIAIQACICLGLNLKIVGEGSDKNRLMKIANNSKYIEFCGRVSDEVKIKLICNCLALIQTQYEDFGITPVEGMSCGKPVIAFGRGGALETVISGVTGEFFYEQTSESIGNVLKNFLPETYLPDTCSEQAKRFSKSRFIKDLTRQVNSI